MKKFSFLTIGDKKYFDTILISAKQAKKIYPDSRFFIYDWGFTPEQIISLKKNTNVEIVKWNILRLELSLIIRWAYAMVRGRLLGNKFMASLQPIRNIKIENLYVNKVFCFLDYIKRFGGNFIFLDGDAFIINSFDELLKQDFDICVTLRRKSEINLGIGGCSALNAGVIFFLGGTEKNKEFINLWIKKINKTEERWIEQTALSRMLLDANPTIFDDFYKETILNADNGNVKIKILPCEIYNYNWIEEGLDRNKVKIVHLKSGRHKKENLIDFVKIFKNSL